MKTLASLTLLFTLHYGFSQEQYSSYGEKISAEDLQPLTSLSDMSTTDALNIKIQANVSQVCQMKGCWMILDAVDNIPIRVTFKDYGFFVPKDIAGKDVIVRGIVSKTTLSEAAAKHYAADAGQQYDSDKEYVEYAFEADGVLVSQE